MKNKIITFDKSLKKNILQYFGYTTNDTGEIVEIENYDNKALTSEGDILTLEEFAGIQKGSLLFIKSDIISLIKLADKLI